MKKTIILAFLFSPILLLSQTSPDTIRVYYLGGQSNMDGYGYNKDLPDRLYTAMEGVYIFHGNPAPDGDPEGGAGIWEQLKPGHGRGFSSTSKANNLSDRFGVELSLTAALKAMYPGEKIALIKYSRGGTSIDSTAARHFGCWEPDFEGENGLNQYDHSLKTIRNALSARDIDNDGKEDVLVPSGIFWMQGESDAMSEDVALRYYDHLKRLMDLLRASLRTDDLPVVIGKISDSWNDESDGKVWDYGELVQYAQEKYARLDKKAAIVRDTRYYKYSDPYHYDSAGYLDFGTRFANALRQLID